MDVDQTVPSDSSCNEETDPFVTVSMQNSKSLGSPQWNQFQEVKDCVNELKNVNESLMTRIKSALVDDCENSTVGRSSIDIVSCLI